MTIRVSTKSYRCDVRQTNKFFTAKKRKKSTSMFVLYQLRLPGPWHQNFLSGSGQYMIFEGYSTCCYFNQRANNNKLITNHEWTLFSDYYMQVVANKKFHGSEPISENFIKHIKEISEQL